MMYVLHVLMNNAAQSINEELGLLIANRAVFVDKRLKRCKMRIAMGREV